MQTSSNIEIRISQLLKRFSTKRWFDFPIAREPALDEVRLRFNRMKRTAGLKYFRLHSLHRSQILRDL
jgi:hypothetical protein